MLVAGHDTCRVSVLRHTSPQVTLLSLRCWSFAWMIGQTYTGIGDSRQEYMLLSSWLSCCSQRRIWYLARQVVKRSSLQPQGACQICATGLGLNSTYATLFPFVDRIFALLIPVCFYSPPAGICSVPLEPYAVVLQVLNESTESKQGLRLDVTPCKS